MTQAQIDQVRLDHVLARSLGAGSHSSLDSGLCVMEAVALETIDISSLTSGQAADAARSACVALFAPTRDSLQRSALELVAAMVAVTPDSLASEKR